jgi:hypothetical protein
MTMAEELNTPDDTPKILHGAKFGDGGDPLETRISELLDRIGEGLREDDATNFEKLQIARKYGPFVMELKSVTPHGEYMRRLKARYPKASYDKCNRWRYLAENEERVAATLEKFPDVAWGPKKMADFLKGCWSPEAEDEEERFDGDEDEYGGILPTELFDTEDEVSDAAEIAIEDEPDVASDEEVGEETETGVLQIPPNTRPKQQTHQVVASKASTPKPNSPKPKDVAQPANSLTDYDVEVRLGFKLSVPSSLTADDVEAALEAQSNWSVDLDTSCDKLISEIGVIVTKAELWDSPKRATR